MRIIEILSLHLQTPSRTTREPKSIYKHCASSTDSLSILGCCVGFPCLPNHSELLFIATLERDGERRCLKNTGMCM